jgi:hypothetical protein
MRILLLAATLGLAVCGNPQPFDPEIEVPLDAAFSLRVNQSAEISGTRLRVRFEDVRDDSRCPTDVVCVWGGNARARLAIDVDGELEPLELNTGLEPRSARVDGFTVVLEALQPEARTAVEISPEDYVVTLRVTPAP